MSSQHMIKEGVILFTDLKDFTLKTSLLSPSQLAELRQTLDTLLRNPLEGFLGEVIKTIGDSYMIFFSGEEAALSYAIQIQESLRVYNTSEPPIRQIELRIALHSGTLEQEIGNTGIDYFGDTVNLTARILDKTPAGKIFTTYSLWRHLDSSKGDKFTVALIGRATFKGILYEVEIYEVLTNPTDKSLWDQGKYDTRKLSETITDPKIRLRDKNIDQIIFQGAAVHAVVGLQPIPFGDISLSIAVYAYMIDRISREYHLSPPYSGTRNVLSSLGIALGSSFLIQQGANGIMKIGLFGFGGFFLIPMNFGTAFAMGRIIDRYFFSQTNNIEFSNEDIKKLFLKEQQAGMSYAKKNKKMIFKEGNTLKFGIIDQYQQVIHGIEGWIDEMKKKWNI